MEIVGNPMELTGYNTAAFGIKMVPQERLTEVTNF